MPKNWRRVFLRYVAWVMRDMFRTSLDIIDASQQDPDTNMLRDDQIILQFKMTSQDSIDVQKLIVAAERIQDSLEMKSAPKITVKPNYIYFIFDEGSPIIATQPKSSAPS